MDIYDTEFNISCVHLQSYIRAQQYKYALLSPKLWKNSHPQKTHQHLDFLTGYLHLVRHLELQGQDVVLLTLRNFYTYQRLSQLSAQDNGVKDPCH
jgi:hypothetical protein